MTVRIEMYKRFVSGLLLMLYASMIFQNHCLDALHYASHSLDILSNDYAHHHHHNGKHHTHQHDIVSAFEKVWNNNEAAQHEENEEQAPTIQLIKFHTIDEQNMEMDIGWILDDKECLHLSNAFFSAFIDIPTPPPKS